MQKAQELILVLVLALVALTLVVHSCHFRLGHPCPAFQPLPPHDSTPKEKPDNKRDFSFFLANRNCDGSKCGQRSSITMSTHKQYNHKHDVANFCGSEVQYCRIFAVILHVLSSGSCRQKDWKQVPFSWT